MNTSLQPERLYYLDALRAFALLLGIVFHASLSFMPYFIGWAKMDQSSSIAISIFGLISHSFRLEVFFLIAGFFSHMTFHKKGGVSFTQSRFIRILVPFVVGWFLLKPLIASGWMLGWTKATFPQALNQGFQSLTASPTGLFVETHLWFLYYLLILTATTMIVRWAFVSILDGQETLRFKIDGLVERIAKSRLSLLVFVIPTIAVLWFMSHWSVDTPDKSLIPHWPTYILYGGIFAFGWILHRQTNLIAEFAKLTPARAILTVTSIIAAVLLADFEIKPTHEYYSIAKTGYIVAYATMMWTLVFGSIGVFKELFSKQIPVIRYVADSAYWLYLIHLPIVIWLQVAVAEYSLHWSIKLIGITAVTLAFEFLTYHLFVRSTFIGWVLSGRTHPFRLFPQSVSLTVERSKKQYSSPVS